MAAISMNAQDLVTEEFISTISRYNSNVMNESKSEKNLIPDCSKNKTNPDTAVPFLNSNRVDINIGDTSDVQTSNTVGKNKNYDKLISKKDSSKKVHFPQKNNISKKNLVWLMNLNISKIGCKTLDQPKVKETKGHLTPDNIQNNVESNPAFKISEEVALNNQHTAVVQPSNAFNEKDNKLVKNTSSEKLASEKDTFVNENNPQNDSVNILDKNHTLNNHKSKNLDVYLKYQALFNSNISNINHKGTILDMMKSSNSFRTSTDMNIKKKYPKFSRTTSTEPKVILKSKMKQVDVISDKLFNSHKSEDITKGSFTVKENYVEVTAGKLKHNIHLEIERLQNHIYEKCMQDGFVTLKYLNEHDAAKTDENKSTSIADINQYADQENGNFEELVENEMELLDSPNKHLKEKNSIFCKNAKTSSTVSNVTFSPDSIIIKEKNPKRKKKKSKITNNSKGRNSKTDKNTIERKKYSEFSKKRISDNSLFKQINSSCSSKRKKLNDEHLFNLKDEINNEWNAANDNQIETPTIISDTCSPVAIEFKDTKNQKKCCSLKLHAFKDIKKKRNSHSVKLKGKSRNNEEYNFSLYHQGQWNKAKNKQINKNVIQVSSKNMKKLSCLQSLTATELSCSNKKLGANTAKEKSISEIFDSQINKNAYHECIKDKYKKKEKPDISLVQKKSIFEIFNSKSDIFGKTNCKLTEDKGSKFPNFNISQTESISENCSLPNQLIESSLMNEDNVTKKKYAKKIILQFKMKQEEKNIKRDTMKIMNLKKRIENKQKKINIIRGKISALGISNYVSLDESDSESNFSYISDDTSSFVSSMNICESTPLKCSNKTDLKSLDKVHKKYSPEYVEKNILIDLSSKSKKAQSPILKIKTVPETPVKKVKSLKNIDKYISDIFTDINLPPNNNFTMSCPCNSSECNSSSSS